MKSISILLYFILISTFQFSVSAQNNELKGKVIDNETNEGLAFVNIVYGSKNQGITTDIDGKFIIKKRDEVQFLKFSYLGYEPLQLNKDDIQSGNFLTVRLNKKVFNINEVVILPGENPAHRIIYQVLENRKLNNPDKLSDYSFTSYNKMIFTMDVESAKSDLNEPISLLDSAKTDSSKMKMKQFFKNQHLFLMESVSERKYKKPGKVNEEVIASRVSGLQQPSFVLLATQLQSFSFYDEMLTLMESRYINPISTGSTSRYFFNIEDTTITERGDTVFSISFRPKKNKNFEGLSGLLNINTHKYAIQSVVAGPVESNGMLDIKIQQNYKLIDDEYWFPVELNTDLVFGNFIKPPSGKEQPNLIGIGKSYLTKIKINENAENNRFKAIELDVNKSAYAQSDSVWNKYRYEPLDKREIRTYKLMDSIGKEEKLDLKLKMFKVISTGYIPFYFIDIAVLSLLDFNVYEGFRPGMGFRTNDKISTYFSVGAYTAYGFKDEAFKYGGHLLLNLAPRQEFQVGFDYKNDVIESSGYQFYNENAGFNSTELYRQYLIKDMTYSTDYTANVQFRTLKRFKVNILSRKSIRKNTSSYSFLNEGYLDEPSKEYQFLETGVQLKFAPNEKLAYLAGELITSNPNNTPVLYINLLKGFKNNLGDFDYSKIEVRLDIGFLTKSFGRSSFQIVGGKVFGDLPYFMLYNGHESYYDFDVETANSFATMRMNEFLSDEFVSIHFRQDFGRLIFKAKKFKPKLVFASSIGFGQLQKPELHYAIEFKTMEKGYFESGLLFNNIIKQMGFIGYGFGLFYRYGPYSFSNNSDNFAFKITLTFDI